MWEPSDRVWHHLVLVPVSSVFVFLMFVVFRYGTSRHVLYCFVFAVCCVCEGRGFGGAGKTSGASESGAQWLRKLWLACFPTGG